MQLSRASNIAFFEFWPSWVMYFPVLVQWLWLSARYRSLTLPHIANPTIHHAAHIKLVLTQFGINLPAHIGIAPGTASYYRITEHDEKVPCAH